MTDAMNHAAKLRGVLAFDGLADAAQAERPQRVALRAVRAVGRLDLGDVQRGHQDCAPSPSPAEPLPGGLAAGGSSAPAGAAAAPACPSAMRSASASGPGGAAAPARPPPPPSGAPGALPSVAPAASATSRPSPPP